VKPPPFQAFLDAHSTDVHRFLVALVGPQEAEDCFQETFLAALRAYPRLRDASNLRSWVLTIAHRKAMDAHRSRGRRPRPVPEVPDRGREDGLVDPGLWAAVRDLPPKQRGAVALRYVADLPYREVAAALRCTEEAARQSARAGLRRLREVVEG
jgi:RNA polymerase sigma factor (sigma-70 family)